MKKMKAYKAVLVSAAVCFVLPACHLDKEPEPEVTPSFLVESIELEGVTQEPARVEVNKVADQDGAADDRWRVRFNLDGRDGPTSLPEDKGARQSHQLMVKAAGSDGEEVYKKVTITLGE